MAISTLMCFDRTWRIRILFFLCTLTILPFELRSQELGYLGGVNRIGHNPRNFQLLYGFTLGKRVSKSLYLESGLFYSQRQYENEIQADYASFYLMPQIGTFRKRYGLYFAPMVSLNPTLHHSNIENHTYVSAGLGIGGRLKVLKRVWLDAKVLYDKGLTGAYFENGSYREYDGTQIHLGLKFDLECR